MKDQEEGWIREARGTLRAAESDFFRVHPWRYWWDFGLSLLVAYTAGTVFLLSPDGSWAQLIAYPLAVFWLYRVGSLVHEVAHLAQGEMRVFKVTWNLLVGIVTLTPSPFFTRHHRDHHSQRMYGRQEDPEYIVNVFQPGSWKSLVVYAVWVAIFPVVVFLRFLLTPLTYLTPAIREATLTRFSALTLNWRYERRLTAQDRWAIAAVEWPCCLRAMAIPAGVLLGLSPWTRLLTLYSVALGVLVLNQMRLLADHHFESHGVKLSLNGHIQDSCNYTGRDVFTWLFFPFSIRYHALHHLFPSLPYHNLAAAHQWLVARLPVDSPYRALDQKSWWSVARRTLLGVPG
jgi:fatty acid desaturase